MGPVTAGAGRVSIVVPTRGDSWSLRAMLASLDVALPIGADVEVILVHDGDGTALTDELVAGFGHPITRTATGRRSGPATARNLGADLATGDVIVFLDDDVIVPFGWHEGLHRALDDHPDAGLIGGPLRSVAEGNLISQMFEALIIRHEHRDGRWYLASACLAARPDALRTLGGFDRRFPDASGEDWDLSRRAHAAGIPVAHSPHLTIHHRNPTRPTQLLSRTRRYAASTALRLEASDDGPCGSAAGTVASVLNGSAGRSPITVMRSVVEELSRRHAELRSRHGNVRSLTLLSLHLPWFLAHGVGSLIQGMDR
jgi:glycosyltransferase involved in cell wall biosynthesis